MSSVFIVGEDSKIAQMFERRGWELVSTLQEADLVQFIGGADVSPHLYGQPVHRNTYYDIKRDRKEMSIFWTCFFLNKPMAGICRGAQFLHVMHGGWLYQDVNNHLEDHWAEDLITGLKVKVTSTHHQMIIPNVEGLVVGIADGVSDSRLTYEDGELVIETDYAEDVEAILYDNALCFQPHPEFEDGNTQDWYFDLLRKL